MSTEPVDFTPEEQAERLREMRRKAQPTTKRKVTPKQREHLKAIAAEGGRAAGASNRIKTVEIVPEEVNIFAEYKGRPVAFISKMIDPETGKLFVLYPAQVRFLEEAFGGTERYSELVYSAPKKSGKTTFAAAVILYVTRVEGGPFAEAYCVANDLEQASGRVYKGIARILRANPWLRRQADVFKDTAKFTGTGATIEALGASYASAAGVNPTIVSFDELWGYTSERSHRLWDELVPVPTRTPSIRFTTTYAGFEGESDLLEGLYKKGLQGEQIAPGLYRQPGLLMYWTHEPVAPWQTQEWLDQARQQLRPNAYLRMIENRFVSSESGFVDIAWWDACTSKDIQPLVMDRNVSVWVGVDASVKRDHCAIVAVTWSAETKKVRLVWHRIFKPSPDDPIDFEATIEATLRDLRSRFIVRTVRYDPYQMASPAQRLVKDHGLPMVEFPQTTDRLTAMGSNLYELVKAGNVEAYPDDEIRKAIGAAVALETSRGWKIAKEKASAKIDVVVALAMAALAAVEGQTQTGAVPAPIQLTKPSIWAGLGGQPAPIPDHWVRDPGNDGFPKRRWP